MNKYYLIEDIWQIEKLKINSKWGENLEDEMKLSVLTDPEKSQTQYGAVIQCVLSMFF